ncbi:hypothetical protein [Micromonospora sp. NPDC005189]
MRILAVRCTAPVLQDPDAVLAGRDLPNLPTDLGPRVQPGLPGLA